MAHKIFDSDDESEDARPAISKRKKPNSSPAPSGRNKTLRRSGRVRKPPSSALIEESVASARIPARRKRARGTSKMPSSLSTSSSHSGTTSSEMGQSETPPPQHQTLDAPDSVQAFFDDLENDLHVEQDKSQRQRREIEDLKKQLREKDKKQTGSYHESPASTSKRDKVIEAKDDEIKELKGLLKATRDFRAASKLAVDTRDKELARLRLKHTLLIKAAKNATNRWGGMGELAEAVEDAAE